jgi:hypothetical protein
MFGCRFAAASLLASLVTATAMADDLLRYPQNGVTTYETNRAAACLPSPCSCPAVQPACCPPCNPAAQPQGVRSYWVPVTEYRCETYRVYSWNPFEPSCLTQQLVPRTHWELRSEIIPPPHHRSMAANTVLPPPVPTVAERRELVACVPSYAARPAAVLPPPACDPNPPCIGGVMRLDKQPPRFGMPTSGGYPCVTR